MGVQFSNRATTTLLYPVDAGARQFELQDAGTFPVLGPGDWGYLTLSEADHTEVVRVSTLNGASCLCEPLAHAYNAEPPWI